MAAILELKFFNSFWLKKLDTVVEVENTTGILDGAVSSATIVLTEDNLDIGVGQAVNWAGADIPLPTIYKKIDNKTFILSESVSIDDAEVLTFGPITNFDFIPNAYPPTEESSDWFVEEARIRGGYNNTNVDLGVKAYIVEDNINQQHRKSSLIYSGIFNSRTCLLYTSDAADE